MFQFDVLPPNFNGGLRMYYSQTLIEGVKKALATNFRTYKLGARLEAIRTQKKMCTKYAPYYFSVIIMT